MLGHIKFDLVDEHLRNEFAVASIKDLLDEFLLFKLAVRYESTLSLKLFFDDSSKRICSAKLKVRVDFTILIDSR